MRITRMRVLATLAAVCVVAVAAGAALAVGKSAKVTAAAAEEIINACRHPNGGWVRIVASPTACRPREQAVSWNVAGPKGDPGPPGPPGPKGDPGAGLTKLGDLAGIACTTDGGDAGEVRLDFAGDEGQEQPFTYDGDGGIPLGGWLRQALFAWRVMPETKGLSLEALQQWLQRGDPPPVRVPDDVDIAPEPRRALRR